ncbi:MAG TPA: hypothetical protein VHD76_02165 [Bryobacteraceae bacterium]|nr:hypothetical protein [Bryobacteraceae bacterium]
MEIVGNRKFVEVPGDKIHELPPLLVRTAPSVKRLDRVMELAGAIVERDDIVPFSSDEQGADAARRKMDLAIQLVESYLTFVTQWQWGDSILEWVRQCEITFGARVDLRNLLRADLWPHAGRSSFVRLLEDKSVDTGGVAIEKAVGMRLTFRQPPPISCFSDQFLFFLQDNVGGTAYRAWADLTPDPVSCLPPERFSVRVFDMSQQ